MKPGLELDLIQDTITFDPVGLGLPKDPQTWSLVGGVNDAGVEAVLQMTTVPEPATLLLVACALALLASTHSPRRT